MNIGRRELLAGAAVLAVAERPDATVAQTPEDFDIDSEFAQFMRDLGASANDSGGRVAFTGRDPILRSHFRIGSAMAIPAMGAAVGAAAVWRARTGQEQDLTVDLRDSVYNVNPLVGMILQRQQAAGLIPPSDPLPGNFSFRNPTVNGLLLQAPIGFGNPMTFVAFET